GVAVAAEQEAGMEDDDLGAGRLRDAGGVIEHADRHVQLLAAFGMAHEARDRSVDGQNDVGLARQLAETLGPRVVHPELPLEVDLAGGEASLLEQLDRLLRAFPRRDARGAVMELHAATLADAVRPPSYPRLMPKKPSRIDLLELDIDLRLTDLWREAGQITEGHLAVVAAFLRPAHDTRYGDALT